MQLMHDMSPVKPQPLTVATHEEKIAARNVAHAAKERKRRSKRIHQFLRATFASLVAILPILSFGLTAVPLASGSWAYTYTNTEQTSWIDVSPVNGNCSCTTMQVNYCLETSDAFQGAAYVSVVAIGAEALVILAYAVELGSYGLFGGSHTVTRVQLIVSLLALATLILSVISWMSTYSNTNCGNPSFESNGAALGAPFFVRCVEIVGMFGFVLYVTSMFPKTNRGPPSIPLVACTLTLLVTSITTFLKGWMTVGDLKYNPWTACTCTTPCSGMAGMLTMSMAMSSLALVFGFLTIFFMALRAVDNEGASLKLSTGFGIVTFICQLLSVIGFTLAFSSGCGKPLASEGFTEDWPFIVTALAVVTQGLFVVLNIVYMLPACWDPDVPPDMTMEQARAALAARAPHERTIYYRFWWDHLKDPRTLAHEEREEDEDDNALSESDEEKEVASDVVDGVTQPDPAEVQKVGSSETDDLKKVE